MNYEIWQWTKKDLEELIGQSESLRLELKSSQIFSKDNSKVAESLSQEVSAFANTEGGLIVIGITERREGKSRIADQIDEGIDSQVWSPERLQQIIESNVRPYLTGLRVKSIPLTDTLKRCAFVIYVPQGNTAYQANDDRYYSRSEYSIKSLPDHEIRLRMFRGKIPKAIVQVENWEKTSGYFFDLIIKNVSEVTIREFKLQVSFSPNSIVQLPDKFPPIQNWYFKDNYPVQYGRYLRAEPEDCLNVIIYPQDTFFVKRFVLNNERHKTNAILDWTIYLNDTSPIQGQINLTSHIDAIISQAIETDLKETQVLLQDLQKVGINV